MAEVISLIPERLQEQTMNVTQLIETLDGLCLEVKQLSFGENGTHRSTGPCAEEMTILTQTFAETINQMASSMRQLVEYIRAGAKNLEEVDTFLANTCVTVGVIGVSS